MHSTELFFRKEADRAREQIREFRNEQRGREERRQEDKSEARREINFYIDQGMERNIAVNFVLDEKKISIQDRKEVRKFFKYGCYTISCMVGLLPDIYSQNSSNLVLEAI
jgi:hypothetical protein